MVSESVTFAEAEQELGTTACVDCGTAVRMERSILAMFPRQMCNDCEARKRGEVIAKEKPLTSQERLAKQWADEDEGICPRRFRDTDVDQLRKIWGGHKVDAVTGWDRKSSKGFLFRGKSGAGKTRLMLALFKACHFEGLSVKVLWPEDMLDHSVRAAREGEFGSTLRRLCAPALLGLDDALITGASDERAQRFLLALADARYRQCRPLFLTSQVGGDEYAAAADKWGDLGPSGKKRLEALFRRFSATGKVIVPYTEEPELVGKGGRDE